MYHAARNVACRVAHTPESRRNPRADCSACSATVSAGAPCVRERERLSRVRPSARSDLTYHMANVQCKQSQRSKVKAKTHRTPIDYAIDDRQHSRADDSVLFVHFLHRPMRCRWCSTATLYDCVLHAATVIEPRVTLRGFCCGIPSTSGDVARSRPEYLACKTSATV